MTYDDAVEAWFDERLAIGEIAAFTAKKSRQKALILSSFIGDTELDEIQQKDIVSAIGKLRQSGNSHYHGEKGFSQSSIRQMFNAGSAACKQAVERGYAKKNPFDGIRRPRVNDADRHSLNEDDLKLLVEWAYKQMTDGEHNPAMSESRKRSFLLAVIIAAMTGMRRGEIFALKWRDIDMVGKKIRVNQAIKAGGELGKPKTLAGIRNISIGGRLIDILQEAYAWQLENVTRKAPIADSYVMCEPDGSLVSLNAFGHWWRDWIDRSGWKGLLFHELRHTHATLLIASGVDIKTVQTRLGHSSADITLNIYAHAVPAKDVAAADDFDAKIMGGVS